MYWTYALRSVSACFTPSHADWLKDLSSTLPTSVTKPTQNTSALVQSGAAPCACTWTGASRVISANNAITKYNFFIFSSPRRVRVFGLLFKQSLTTLQVYIFIFYCASLNNTKVSRTVRQS